MPRWLSNVNNLLTQLDGTVETAAEERASLREDGNDESEQDAAHTEGMLQDILAKRGLETALSVEEEEEQEEAMDDDKGTSGKVAPNDAQNEIKADPLVPADGSDSASLSAKEPVTDKNDTVEVARQKVEQDATKEVPSLAQLSEKMDETTGSQAERVLEPKEKDERGAPTTPSRAVSQNKPSAATSSKLSPLRPPSATPRKADAVSKKELLAAQKESKTLRRHVLTLNQQLEVAEAELAAQRNELDRAAQRLEADRVKQKEALENLKKMHATEVTQLKEQHQTILQDQKARLEEQLQIHQAQLKDLESRRKQEGGDWNKELASADERAQVAQHKVAILEDEKATLLSQISTLQAQQEVLGSRLESVTRTSDSAIERERAAEEKLDAVLSQHAHQIAQRQAREAELERTIQELGAALVVARDNGKRSFASGESDSGDGDKFHRNGLPMIARVETLESDLKAAQAALELEREKSGALHAELRDLSKEASNEASTAHTLRLQYERQIADLNLTISRLQANAKKSPKEGISGDSASTKESSSLKDDEKIERIRLLSDEMMKLQSTVGQQKSEILTLTKRLQSAISRAEQADNELENMRMYQTISDGSGDRAYKENSSETVLPLSRGLTNRSRNGRNGGTIRSAINLHPGNGERSEQIGKAIDAVDDFAVSTGKYLRRNPLARAGFILYLLLIHVWSFALLFFHAHSFETLHGDFGSGSGIAPGPHALMHQPAASTDSVGGERVEAPPVPDAAKPVT